VNLKGYFGVKRLGDITWSHAVNSREKLDRTLADPKVMIVESDMRVSQSGEVVAVHPPETESDLAVGELIEKVAQSHKGLKLDFKDQGAVERVLRILGLLGQDRPVILNGDILQGNGAKDPGVEAGVFLRLCSEGYPVGLLSIGWTTMADPNLPYTQQNVEEMARLAEGVGEATFPARACLLPNSWPALTWLLGQGNHSLTVWNNEPVGPELIDWIKENTDPDKTMYDFIDERRESVRLW